jgi:hypothetical protein
MAAAGHAAAKLATAQHEVCNLLGTRWRRQLGKRSAHLCAPLGGAHQLKNARAKTGQVRLRLNAVSLD